MVTKLDTWTLPGYSIGDRLGAGGSGDVWQATERSTGRTVALKRVRHGDHSSVLAAVAAQRRVPSKHFVPILDVLSVDEEPVLVMEFAAGGSLATLLATRRTLSPGEVVTLVSPLAAALAAAHATGLVHGDVSPGNVLFATDGRPMLADFAIGPLHRATADFADPAVAAGGQADWRSDVFGLGALGFAALTGQAPWAAQDSAAAFVLSVAGRRPSLSRLAPAAPADLVSALESAMDRDPGRRPTASSLADSVLASCAPTPIKLGARSVVSDDTAILTAPVPSAQPAGAPRPHRRPAPPPPKSRWSPPVLNWRPSRGAVVGAAVALVVAVAVIGGVMWGRGGHRSLAGLPEPSARSRTSSASTTSTGGSPDWSTILAGLGSTRAAAFDDDRPAELSQVYSAGSSPLAIDLARIDKLDRAGLHVEGLTDHVDSVRVVKQASDSAQIKEIDSLSGYRLQSASGQVEAIGAAHPMQVLVVHLVRQAGVWRISAVTSG